MTKTEASELLSALSASQSNQQTATTKGTTHSAPLLAVTSFLGCFEYTSARQQDKETKDKRPDNTAGPSRVVLPNTVAIRKSLSNEMTIQLGELPCLLIAGDVM